MAKRITKPTESPTHDEIAQRAYAIFEQRGCPQGCDQEHWFEAEAQLLAGTTRPATTAPTARGSRPAARLSSSTR